MMKKIIALMIVVLAVALTGCGSEVEEKVSGKSEFVLVENTDAWFIVYHKKTKVMYAVSRGSNNCGNFTLLVKADGTPMLWEGE